MPQSCHIMRSTTVNDGLPQSRCAVALGYCYSRSDRGAPAADHTRPYKAVITGMLDQSWAVPGPSEADQR
jgi:hypothetical protein